MRFISRRVIKIINNFSWASEQGFQGFPYYNKRIIAACGRNAVFLILTIKALCRTLIHLLCWFCDITIAVLITRGSTVAEGPRDALTAEISPTAAWSVTQNRIYKSLQHCLVTLRALRVFGNGVFRTVRHHLLLVIGCRLTTSIDRFLVLRCHFVTFTHRIPVASTQQLK